MQPYEEDTWDWDWPEDPQVTYRDAITQLSTLAQERNDVRVEWNGKRALPRDDARVVFTGSAASGEIRVRVRSATQLSDFSQLIKSATPLADSIGIWYPEEQIIVARLVGDYDQFHTAVARVLAPGKKNVRFDPDSPLGRDVAGILATTGAFPAADKTAPAGSLSRAIRLVAANQDLRLLYGPRDRQIPAAAIELTGFDVPDGSCAEKILHEYGTAYLFKLGKATGVSLRLRHSEYRIGSRRLPAYSGKVRFPQRAYDEHPAELYAAGNSAARDPLERYLKYYQVLEFYMTKAADSVAASQSVTVQKAASPLRPPPDNALRLEQNKLDAVISLAVTQAQAANLLGDRELFSALSSPQVIQDVQTLSTDGSGQRIAGHDYRVEISNRIYGIRNRIVHMKEGGGRKNQVLLAPYSREARDLAADLRLARFLAEHSMEHWSTELQ